MKRGEGEYRVYQASEYQSTMCIISLDKPAKQIEPIKVAEKTQPNKGPRGSLDVCEERLGRHSSISAPVSSSLITNTLTSHRETHSARSECSPGDATNCSLQHLAATQLEQQEDLMTKQGRSTHAACEART